MSENTTSNQQQPIPTVIWNDSEMKTTYANVCNVMGTREEIMVLFGSNQAWKTDQKEVEVMLSDRIVLNPYTAKRLKLMLDMGLQQYEERFGEIKL
jgi:hypothetical protein